MYVFVSSVEVRHKSLHIGGGGQTGSGSFQCLFIINFPPMFATTTMETLLLDVILDNISTYDFINLRLTFNNAIVQATSKSFGQRYFQHAQFIITRNSLEILRDIANHSHFSSSVKTLIFCQANVRSASECDHFKIVNNQQDQKVAKAIKEETKLWANGIGLRTISDALLKLPNCRVIWTRSINDSYAFPFRLHGLDFLRQYLMIDLQRRCNGYLCQQNRRKDLVELNRLVLAAVGRANKKLDKFTASSPPEGLVVEPHVAQTLQATFANIKSFRLNLWTWVSASSHIEIEFWSPPKPPKKQGSASWVKKILPTKKRDPQTTRIETKREYFPFTVLHLAAFLRLMPNLESLDIGLSATSEHRYWELENDLPWPPNLQAVTLDEIYPVSLTWLTRIPLSVQALCLHNAFIDARLIAEIPETIAPKLAGKTMKITFDAVEYHATPAFFKPTRTGAGNVKQSNSISRYGTKGYREETYEGSNFGAYLIDVSERLQPIPLHVVENMPKIQRQIR